MVAKYAIRFRLKYWISSSIIDVTMEACFNHGCGPLCIAISSTLWIYEPWLRIRSVDTRRHTHPHPHTATADPVFCAVSDCQPRSRGLCHVYGCRCLLSFRAQTSHHNTLSFISAAADKTQIVNPVTHSPPTQTQTQTQTRLFFV